MNLYQAKKKYKPGTKIKIINCQGEITSLSGCHKNCIGKIFKIKEIETYESKDGKSKVNIYIKKSKNNMRCDMFDQSEIEIIKGRAR